MSTDAYVLQARTRKAAAIAEVLCRAGALGVDVALVDSAGRRLAERAAGVRESSDETWAMVADMVAARRAVIARFGADPFEGLT